MTRHADELTNDAGAYLLLIELTRPLDLPKRFADQCLSPGIYVYAGSARGAGGIRARCRRHLGRRHLEEPETRHWHIDWLTGRAHDVQAFAFPGDEECRLIGQLVARENVQIPIAGFGSSDCNRCKAHLVALHERLLRADGLAFLLSHL